jgi:hypothetical protein
MYKVFIGTLYCKEENGFEECCRIINSQKNIEITHHIIKDLYELEAHQELTKYWNNIKNDFDFFIKIDPDMTLLHENTIYEICERMTKEKIDFLQYGLYDFISNSQIFGLNTYNKNVEFLLNDDKLFPDRCNNRSKYMCIYDTTIQGNHMLFCNNLQAFHYGVHRGLKDQKNLQEKTKIAYKSNGDIRRLYAIKGFEKIDSFSKEKTNFNYQSIELLKAFEDTKKIIGS